ncbi:MAG: hypothetical protein Q4D81_02370 [Eubacteriales bacterium]|nr:hypothetical protein [Eubacteriales bacterium]
MMNKTRLFVMIIAGMLLAGCNGTVETGSPQAAGQEAGVSAGAAEGQAASAENSGAGVPADAAPADESIAAGSESQVTAGTDAAAQGEQGAETAQENQAGEGAASEADVRNIIMDISGRKENGAVYFEIKANFPDQEAISLDLSRGDFNTADCYLAGERIVFSGSKAVSSGFTAQGMPLSGDFDLSIVMPLASPRILMLRHLNEEEKDRSLIIRPAENEPAMRVLFSVSIGNSVKIQPSDEYQFTVFRVEGADQALEETGEYTEQPQEEYTEEQQEYTGESEEEEEDYTEEQEEEYTEETEGDEEYPDDFEEEGGYEEEEDEYEEEDISLEEEEADEYEEIDE